MKNPSYVSPSRARDKLTDQVLEGDRLFQLGITDEPSLQAAKDLYRSWEEYNVTLLEQLFTTNALATIYSSSFGAYYIDIPFHLKVQELREHITEKIRRLRSVIDRIELYPTIAVEQAASGASVQNSVSGVQELGSQLFIVHGHDEAAREAVARFLGIFDLDPIILNEEPNRGGTLIEKLDRYRGIGYAVVLLTPDDIGGVKDSKYHDLRPRPRQNVILELGYFIAALGRNRVATLHKPDIEMPSDYAGSAYIPMDRAGAWKIALARELQDAGYAIDMNKIR